VGRCSDPKAWTASFSEPRPHPVASSIRRPSLHPNGAVSLSSVAPKVRRPRSLPTRAAGFVPRWARSEDQSSPRGVAAGLVPRWARSEDQSSPQVKSRRPRPPAPSIRRPKKLAGWVDSLGWYEKRSRRSIPLGNGPEGPLRPALASPLAQGGTCPPGCPQG
jgi:hypothetical protein